MVVAVNVGHLRDAGAEADSASAGEEMRGQSADEDDDKGKMKHESGQALIQPPLHDIR